MLMATYDCGIPEHADKVVPHERNVFNPALVGTVKKGKDDQKKIVIIDTNLHVQDPHAIILSYFNTQNDTQFIHSTRKSFLGRVMGLVISLVFLKFFFAEMLYSFWIFLLVMILGALLGLSSWLVYRAVYGWVASSRSDGLRGVFYNVAAFTLIVVIFGAFI